MTDLVFAIMLMTGVDHTVYIPTVVEITTKTSKGNTVIKMIFYGLLFGMQVHVFWIFFFTFLWMIFRILLI